MTTVDDAADEIGDEPPAELRYKHRVSLITAVRDIWRFREMVRSLSEREVRARYKQTTLSWGWALISPLALMFIFTVFVDRVADIDTNGVPYALFSYLGLIPWTFFSASLNLSSNTMLSNKSLLNKLYCPREIFPISSVVIAMIDSFIASTALILLFITTGVGPTKEALWFPLILAMQVMYALGTGLVASVSVVYVRDLRNVVPLALQVGLFATPVAYGMDAIPESWQGLYSFVNPVAPVIDSYRRTVLMGQNPQWDLFAYGMAGTLVVLLAGYWYFKRVEGGIADVA
jgi:ABC-2 type transport system permease protein/lipopolysaccharide transport system permease protein